MRFLKRADLSSARVGRLDAEKFDLHRLRRNRRRVDGDERPWARGDIS